MTILHIELLQITRHVQQVAQRIIQAMDPGLVPQGTQWQVYVVDAPSIANALVLPGGQIFVFTGILPITATKDGLAAVLGHEVHNDRLNPCVFTTASDCSQDCQAWSRKGLLFPVHLASHAGCAGHADRRYTSSLCGCNQGPPGLSAIFPQNVPCMAGLYNPFLIGNQRQTILDCC